MKASRACARKEWYSASRKGIDYAAELLPIIAGLIAFGLTVLLGLGTIYYLRKPVRPTGAERRAENPPQESRDTVHGRRFDLGGHNHRGCPYKFHGPVLSPGTIGHLSVTASLGCWTMH